MFATLLPRSGSGRWLCTFVLVALALLVSAAGAVETTPPVPRDHFNDYAGVVSNAVARQLNERLAAFERESANQIVVAIFPRMQSDASVEAYTLRVAQAWGVGQKARDNGVVLFAFMQERQLYIQVGRGLETRIPDDRAKRIIEQRIVPRLRAGDLDGGFRDGVDALLGAARSEAPPARETPVEAFSPPAYSSPTPASEPASTPVAPSAFSRGSDGMGGPLFGVFILVAGIVIGARFLGSTNDYGSSGRRRSWRSFGGGGGSSPANRGMFSSSRGFGGSSRGSFSGGGGSFRGGGAGGKW